MRQQHHVLQVEIPWMELWLALEHVEPAKPTCPLFSAAINAASSINVPRAAFTTTAPWGSMAMRFAFNQ